QRRMSDLSIIEPMQRGYCSLPGASHFSCNRLLPIFLEKAIGNYIKFIFQNKKGYGYNRIF
ncbi:MAG TPA: hypothetical protein VFF23_01445, partial [Hanamia sp.]|nr:hypothetical protein [Hanamia sp.]